MMPEAERLCRQTGSPSSSCRTEERIFKRRQKQRASPLTGKRAGGDAVSQHSIDCLHQGSESDKRESLHIISEQREEFGQNSASLCRLIRAYCHVHDIISALKEKKIHTEN
ncbi:regulator of microtubule dynamics protein 2 [Lates japonicus]|uniref:Regulator of microtubule dynamics protein 2 n=1 Tax=Lates japonicus TaxID=270547 RepID=A0AAD3N944_LATJO|nr:regulator of microtubule dynamics protein 2 [Lates japonicus]